MSVPDWWSFLLLGVGAWRIFQLLAEDAILDRPRRRLLRLAESWEKEGDDPGDDYRMKWGIFLTCPRCCGFWLSLGIYLFWVWFPTEALVACTPLALNAVVVGGAKILSPGE